MTRILLIVDAAAFWFDVFQVHDPLRFVVSLLFSLTVPGWSILGFLHIRDVAWLVALCVATSLALEIVLGEIALSWWWHLQILEILLAVICAALLAQQLRLAPASHEGVRQ